MQGFSQNGVQQSYGHLFLKKKKEKKNSKINLIPYNFVRKHAFRIASLEYLAKSLLPCSTG